MTGTDSIVDDIVSTLIESIDDIRLGMSTGRTTLDRTNPSGEQQTAVDVYADELLAERLTAIDGVAQYASEEQQSIINCGTDGISVAVDPLDGTSNVPVNNPVGMIFCLYAAPLPAPGRAIVAAGYVIFAPVTTMVIAHRNAVSRYVLADGDMHLLDDEVTIPDSPRVFGFGGRVGDWPDPFREFARRIERELPFRHYCGAMIADVDAVLTHGGLFAYPALIDSPSGKLRLQFEGNPIGYIIEAAGGRSSTGTESHLSVDPTDLHQRIPFHVGNPDLIERFEAAIG